MIPTHRIHLNHLKTRIEDPKLLELDDYVQSVHAKLYCVELSGALEHVLRDCSIHYCQNCANKYVTNFVKGRANSFPNPNTKNILEIVKSYDKSWAEKLDNFWEGETKSAIGSIVKNRHLIAHGKNSQVSIARIRPWLNQVTKFSNFMWFDIFQLK